MTVPSRTYFENLIPSKLKVTSEDIEIKPQAATIYVSLHPLFTSSPSEIFSNSELDPSSSELLKAIADSAAIILSNYFQANKDFDIISIWMAAERVLEAGAIWGSYLMYLRSNRIVGTGTSSIRTRHTMGPLQKCSVLLTSFAGRWKEASIYVEVWEIFL